MKFIDAPRLVLVDDEPDILAVLETYLKQIDGPTIHCFQDSTKALEFCKKTSPNLVITDHHMPELTGEQMHDQLLAEGFCTHTEFIFLTGFADKKLLMRLFNKEVFGLIEKPCEASEFVHMAESALKLNCINLRVNELMQDQEQMLTHMQEAFTKQTESIIEAENRILELGGQLATSADDRIAFLESRRLDMKIQKLIRTYEKRVKEHKLYLASLQAPSRRKII